MTNSNSENKKGKSKAEMIDDFKTLIIKGEIQLKDIFDALAERDCRKPLEKPKKLAKKNKLLTPSAGNGGNERDDDEESSRSDPFSDSLSNVEEEESDVFNQGINIGDLSNCLRREHSQAEYSTERSIVTIENQNIERRVDPFNDGQKIIGQMSKKGNPPSKAPIQMRQADPIKLFSEVMTEGLNVLTYGEKLEKRKTSLKKDGLTKEKLEPVGPTIEDLEMRSKLKLEKERCEIDKRRRVLKIPEPNMVNTENGEWSDEWRKWFDGRLRQIEDWLLEDATMFRDLPPSNECAPPRGVDDLAADWNVFRKSEIEVAWDYEKYGPIRLTDNMAYDGNKLFDPISGNNKIKRYSFTESYTLGKSWNNIVEVLETEVRKQYEQLHPGTDFDVFETNEGFFWSRLLQQWYDNVNVSAIMP